MRVLHAVLRPVAIGAVAALLVAGCKKSPAPTSAPVTEPPTASPGVQSVGNFQLAGSIDHAFQGVGPPVQVSLAGVNLSPTPTPSAAAPASATGFPQQQGVMRVTLDEVSSALADRCGAGKGDKINVFWLTDTQFDSSLLGGTTLEGSLEGRRLGMAGSIFLTGGAEQNLGLPTATPSPAVTAGVANTNCTLVADRVSTSETLPTIRPTGAPAVTRAPTARPATTPRRTATPHPTPTHTPTPTAATGPSGASGASGP